jgi:hypothetical protein
MKYQFLGHVIDISNRSITFGLGDSTSRYVADIYEGDTLIWSITRFEEGAALTAAKGFIFNLIDYKNRNSGMWNSIRIIEG